MGYSTNGIIKIVKLLVDMGIGPLVYILLTVNTSAEKKN